MDNKKSPGGSRTSIKLPVNSSLVGRTVHRFCFYLYLVVAWHGVLNSSLCWETTHTQAGHTGAEHYNSHHQVLIGVIISTLTDLSIQLFKEFLSRLRYRHLCNHIVDHFLRNVHTGGHNAIPKFHCVIDLVDRQPMLCFK
jgi:hypothetical protein